MKKLCRFCLLAVLLLGLVVPSLAAGPDKEGPIVILHTNDVHASLDHYPAVAGYKKRLEAPTGCFWRMLAMPFRAAPSPH